MNQNTNNYDCGSEVTNTVQRTWQLICGWGQSLSNHYFSQHCSYVLFMTRWENSGHVIQGLLNWYVHTSYSMV